ncbi:plastocyanin [Rhodobacteraceae bacterium THAF1]|uniref:cupredoxin domain-containing protein n=1 Tax=Palleronia sp. THAF1 TaxID=2587842 RepID=UPI000F3C336E|nr:plastocyanin/azurin family copper-binding protein [Palleronia sp. THAF1]QFU07223.1 plastocyanin [Palleronia sp. THAF1]VDC20888.1 plastocyanin [Rhodobacteraceae bacterium THAF1]
MKKTLVAVAMLGALAAPGMALANGYHRGAHDGPVLHAGNVPIGYPGEPALIDRTIRVSMVDASDHVMGFNPDAIEIAHGETIQFVLTNEGSGPHDFVMATPGEIADHRDEMQGFDDMRHEADYAVRVEPEETRTLIWTFANEGDFEFACLIPGHYEAGMHGPLTVD